MLRSNLRTFRQGMGLMWRNGKTASAIRKRARSDGAGLTYAELQLLRRSGEDTQKLVQAGFVWLVVPELFPALLYFYPRALPSTFETAKGRDKRHATLTRMRTSACLELLSTLEEQGATRTGRKAVAAANAVAIAEGTLRARSPSRSLAHVQGCAHAPWPGDKGHAELEKIEQRLQKRAAARRRAWAR